MSYGIPSVSSRQVMPKTLMRSKVKQNKLCEDNERVNRLHDLKIKRNIRILVILSQQTGACKIIKKFKWDRRI